MTVNGRGVSTPCIGVCSTVVGDTVCRGCKRYAHEVVQWNRYSDEQKALVIKRLDTFLSQVLASKLLIISAERLRQRLEALKIPFAREREPAAWVAELLRRAPGELADMEACGLRPLPPWGERSPAALRDAIADEFYALSEAHYERYMRGV